jgi:hypothetical protein
MDFLISSISFYNESHKIKLISRTIMVICCAHKSVSLLCLLVAGIKRIVKTSTRIPTGILRKKTLSHPSLATNPPLIIGDDEKAIPVVPDNKANEYP